MQEEILLFLNNNSSQLATYIAHFSSFLAEAFVPMLFISFIYWTVNKRAGLNLAYCLGLSVLINTIIKIFVRAPRPFEKLPELKAGRLHTATGYSFPSTHSQIIATFMTSCALYIKKVWFYIFAVFCILIVAVSRLYFCVHWPVDVIFGTLFGVIISTIVYFCLEKILSNTLMTMKFSSLVFAISIVTFVLHLIVYYKFNLFRYIKIADNFKTVGLVAGLSLGALLEMLYVRFEPATTVKNKILVMIIGLVSVGIIYLCLKMLLPKNVISCFIRYFLVAVWVTFGWPFVAKKCRILSQE